jgi:pimeloyl-ACP methyl ester carboxylesterase
MNIKNSKLVVFTLLIALTFNFGCSNDFELSSSADDFFHVKRKDYFLPVRVRGNTASKKILLFIQGGPAINTLDYAEVDYPKWKNTLEKEYAIAYYDQLGTGNRTGKFTLDDISIDSWLEDIHDIAKVLRDKYQADVFLYGHSFGGELAYDYITKYRNNGIPKGYISFDGPFTIDSDDIRWVFRRNFLLNLSHEFISQNKNIEYWHEVSNYLEQHTELKTLEEQKQWNLYVIGAKYNGLPVNEDDLPIPGIKDYLNVVFTSSYGALTSNINAKALDEVTSKLLRDEITFDLTSKLDQIDQPLLIITGRYDDVFPPEEAHYLYDHIPSVKKELVVIDNAAHDPYLQNPEVFYQAVRNFLATF